LKKDILFLTSRFPYPLNKGDKLRAYFQIKDLSRFANIYLISLSEKPIEQTDLDALNPYCKSIKNYVLPKNKRLLRVCKSIFSSQPFSVNYFYNSKIKKEINQQIKEIKPDLIHCHLIRTVRYIDSSYYPITSIDFMDCFSIGTLKELKETNNLIRKIFLRVEYTRLVKAERESFEKFNRHFIISQQDKDALPLADASSIEILRNGVDFNVFYPKTIAKEYDLLFSGHMAYVPNIAAAKYAIQQVVPILPPSNKLLIAGIGVTPEITSLKSNQVIIQEHFPHIREAFWKSRILVAPMIISIGLQNKILQAMAMKIPVVCTPQANAAINAPEGIAILTATEPQQFVHAIQRLLDDEDYYQEIANQAYNYVRANFDWETINADFATTLLDS